MDWNSVAANLEQQRLIDAELDRLKRKRENKMQGPFHVKVEYTLSSNKGVAHRRVIEYNNLDAEQLKVIQDILAGAQETIDSLGNKK